jgi:hypothetical protein
MKVINEGNKEWKPWWVGTRIKCPECEREIILEIGDHKLSSFMQGIYNKNEVSICCEKCYTQIVINKEIKIGE